MILNTQSILSSIKDEKIINENLLVQKDKELALKEIQKEKKLQEQVAMIFKDKAYAPFQEAAIIPPQRLAQIKEKEKEENEDKRRQLKTMALTTAALTIPAATYQLKRERDAENAEKAQKEEKLSQVSNEAQFRMNNLKTTPEKPLKESFTPINPNQQAKTPEELEREKMIKQQELEEERRQKRNLSYQAKMAATSAVVGSGLSTGIREIGGAVMRSNIAPKVVRGLSTLVGA